MQKSRKREIFFKEINFPPFFGQNFYEGPWFLALGEGIGFWTLREEEESKPASNFTCKSACHFEQKSWTISRYRSPPPATLSASPPPLRQGIDQIFPIWSIPPARFDRSLDPSAATGSQNLQEICKLERGFFESHSDPQICKDLQNFQGVAALIPPAISH